MEVFFIIAVVFIVGFYKLSEEKTFVNRGARKSDEGFSTSEESKKEDSVFSEIFNETFLALASFVIKSDDDIANIELERVRNYFKTYYPSKEEQYFDRLNSYLEKEIDINGACKTIINAEFHDKFQMMSQLFNIASADSHIYISEYVALYDIFNLLNLPNLTLITIRGLFGVAFTHKDIVDFKEQSFRKTMDDWNRKYAEQDQQKQEKKQREKRKHEQYWQEQQWRKYQQKKQQEKRKKEQEKQKQQSYNYYKQNRSKSESYSNKSQSKLESAYVILGLKQGATTKEVKKAYRKLAHLHHPDKVAHLGEGSVKQAEMVFRKIKDAYEMVINSL